MDYSPYHRGWKTYGGGQCFSIAPPVHATQARGNRHQSITLPGMIRGMPLFCGGLSAGRVPVSGLASSTPKLVGECEVPSPVPSFPPSLVSSRLWPLRTLTDGLRRPCLGSVVATGGLGLAMQAMHHSWLTSLSLRVKPHLQAPLLSTPHERVSCHGAPVSGHRSPRWHGFLQSSPRLRPDSPNA